MSHEGTEAAATEWGRVDADGTVYVRTKAGERAVGTWLAGGDAAEGLAHFARRYAGLEAEVALLERRLETGAADPKTITPAITRLRSQVASAAAVGDLDSLEQRLSVLLDKVAAKKAELAAARAAAREAANAAKKALADEAVALAESEAWKSAGDRFKAIAEEWKTIRDADRGVDSEQWKRFADARDLFGRRRGTHFAELERRRAEAAERKEELCAEAEALADSTDWTETSAEFRRLMSEWKSVGPAPRSVENQLWERFRGAQDTFFSHRSEVFGARDAEMRENQRLKEEILVELEALDPDADLKAAQTKMRDLLERYDEIGRVPRESMRSLDARLTAVTDRVKRAADAQWERSNPQAIARARETVEMLQTALAKLNKELDGHRAAGRDKKAADTEAAIAARTEWLAEAEKVLAELTG